MWVKTTNKKLYNAAHFARIESEQQEDSTYKIIAFAHVLEDVKDGVELTSGQSKEEAVEIVRSITGPPNGELIDLSGEVETYNFSTFAQISDNQINR